MKEKKRGRGRPPGSKNKTSTAGSSAPRAPGRPRKQTRETGAISNSLEKRMTENLLCSLSTRMLELCNYSLQSEKNIQSLNAQMQKLIADINGAFRGMNDRLSLLEQPLGKAVGTLGPVSKRSNGAQAIGEQQTQ